MLLTPDKQRLLEQPFLLEEHDFLDGSPYILKDAIRQRLSKVDPRWTNTPPEFVQRDGDVVIYRGGLTVCSDTRYAIGTGVIQTTVKDKQTQVVSDLTGFKLGREVAKGHKTAASDLLPRCALLFGVGGYLKTKPRDVTKGNFADWLKSISAKYHWANNGGGERFKDHAKSLNLTWADVQERLEPERTLTRLTDIYLTEQQAIQRLNDIVEELRD